MHDSSMSCCCSTVGKSDVELMIVITFAAHALSRITHTQYSFDGQCAITTTNMHTTMNHPCQVSCTTGPGGESQCLCSKSSVHDSFRFSGAPLKPDCFTVRGYSKGFLEINTSPTLLFVFDAEPNILGNWHLDPHVAPSHVKPKRPHFPIRRQT